MAANRPDDRDASPRHPNTAGAEDRRDSDRRLRRLAWLLDSSIPLPGLRYRIGIDPLLGLIPGIGDLIGLGLSSLIMLEASRLGAPRSVLLRMGGNALVETVFGVIPIFGDIFDAVWKANERNVRLLEGYVERPVRVKRTSRLWVGAMIAVLAFIAFVLVLLVWIFLRWLFTTAF